MSSNILTHQELKQQLRYDENSGVFIWIKVKKNSPIKVGAIAGGYPKSGAYSNIQIDGKKYLTHRLAWFYVYGKFPDGELDHINGNKQDNRIINIREATRSQNMANTRTRKDSFSGIKGVRALGNRWIANIFINRKPKYLGAFDTKEEAAKAFQEYANKVYGEFAVNNCLQK